MTYDFKRKESNIRQLNNYMLTKTLSMFEWQNLPKTIPVKELEKMLQVNGYAFLTEFDGDLFVFSGGLGGEPDAYGNPTTITIANPYLKFNKTLSLIDDGVLICNDDMMMGLIPLYEKHNTMLAENDINMVLNGYNSRMQKLISASDDKTKASAESYVKKVVDGELAIIGENAMFDGVKLHQQNSGGSSISPLIEYHQYIKGMLFNEVGLSSAFNMKKERLITSEVEQGEDSLFPLVYNMMGNRLKAVEKINEMFGTEIDVDFGSVWNLKNKKFVDDLIDNEVNENAIETLNEPSNEPSNEPLETTNAPLETSSNAPLNAASEVNPVIEINPVIEVEPIVEVVEPENVEVNPVIEVEPLIDPVETDDVDITKPVDDVIETEPVVEVEPLIETDNVINAENPVDGVIADEVIEQVERSPLSDEIISQAETVNDAMELLKLENLTDEDIEVIELLIMELESKDNETK